MLRLLATALNLLATLCVVLSPLAVIQWILKGTRMAELDWITTPLTTLFDPLNAILGFLIPVAPMQFGDHQLSIIPGILAFLLTLLFFILSAAATFCRAAEEKFLISQETWKQQIQIRRLEEARKKELQRIGANKVVWIYIAFPFFTINNGVGYFDGYPKHDGKLSQSLTDGLLLQFDQLANAFNYCIESAQAISAYYATLRPMDPQPPFKVTLHATPVGEDAGIALGTCRQLVQFVGDNEVLFSPEVKALMEAHNLTQYKVSSLGFYDFPATGAQEIFRLFSYKNR